MSRLIYKENGKFNKSLISSIAVIFGLIAFLMMFAKVVYIPYFGVVGKGTDLIFGWTDGYYDYYWELYLEVTLTEFNFAIMLAYFLPLIAGIITLFSGLYDKPIVSFVSGGIFLLGTIFLCMMESSWVWFLSDEIKEIIAEEELSKEIFVDLASWKSSKTWSIIFSILGLLCCVGGGVWSIIDSKLPAREKKENFTKRNPNNDGIAIGGQNIADEIVKYKNLFDNGVITEEEYEKKKKQLLGL